MKKGDGKLSEEESNEYNRLGISVGFPNFFDKAGAIIRPRQFLSLLNQYQKVHNDSVGVLQTFHKEAYEFTDVPDSEGLQRVKAATEALLARYQEVNNKEEKAFLTTALSVGLNGLIHFTDKFTRDTEIKEALGDNALEDFSKQVRDAVLDLKDSEMMPTKGAEFDR